VETCCPIVELRQYTLRPGQRETLIDLFDRELVETQEAVGIALVGQFRDLDDPDRFVFVRGFPDMPSRAAALGAFYGGPVWAAHREEANATMIDSTDVLLLRPARPGSGFRPANGTRPPPGATEAAEGLVVATIVHLDAPADEGLVAAVEHGLRPVLAETGASPLAAFVTEASPNTYPALPVREGEHVVVAFSLLAGGMDGERHVAAARFRRWRGDATEALAPWIMGSPQVLMLSPTARSGLLG